MGTELRTYHNASELFVRDYSSAWRRTHLVHPSVWFGRDPEVEEKMLRDPDIAHAVGLRKEQIAGRQWTVTPLYKNSSRASMAVGVATDLLSGIKRFTSAREALARAFFSGKRYARIKFEPRTLRIGDGKPRLWIVPVELEDMDARMYRVELERDGNAGTVKGHRYRWHAGPDQWIKETPTDDLRTIEHRYQDDMTKLGHGSALREALGWVWYAKTHIAQELISAAERYGQGVFRARIDGLADGESGVPNAQRVQTWISLMEDMRGRHVLVHDKKDDIDVVQMSGTGWELLDKLDTKYRSLVLTLVLGANLTTAANEGGSYALAEVQENSTESRIQNDREMMEETLTDELLGPVWYFNRANLVELRIQDEKPRFSIKQEKRLDPQVRANVAAALSAMGVELSLDDVLEQTGMRRPEAGEPTIKGRAPVPDAMGMLGAMGQEQFARFGAGIDFEAEYDEKKHPRKNDGKFAPKGQGEEGGEKKEKPKKKTAKKEAPKAEEPKPEAKDKQKELKKDADLVRNQYRVNVYEGRSDEYVVAHDKWTRSVSEDESDAILAWSREGYSRIRALQFGNQPRTPPPIGQTFKEMAALESALAKCPSDSGTFWRGLAVSPADFERMSSDGTILELAAHSSWSSNRGTAYAFASDEKDDSKVQILLRADSSSMKQISTLSQYQDEHERIGGRGARFEVVRTDDLRANGNKVVTIHLREVGKDKDPNVRFRSAS